ncbi:hypothetical protein M378DRAFT_865607 [Amanita muscaria Koide BX008]|uniref:Uncharacterized protein n=1 Tax=Amanita muscaria (strain Koide BX008) TaxID=946122 RepID=A0A0C2WXJ2_AMAMK|nr:hypothetical protein M378DRAFT_865607 [Amanita muscaria Koide BX008]
MKGQDVEPSTTVMALDCERASLILHRKVIPDGSYPVPDEAKGWVEVTSGKKVMKKVIKCFLSQKRIEEPEQVQSRRSEDTLLEMGLKRHIRSPIQTSCLSWRRIEARPNHSNSVFKRLRNKWIVHLSLRDCLFPFNFSSFDEL